jgi:microcin C transport system substrate-binding protein
MPSRRRLVVGALGLAAAPVLPRIAAANTVPAAAAPAAPSHGIAMHGRPKYGPGFQHFDYVNPNAPKGGSLYLAGTGTFDTLNAYALKGTPESSIGLVHDSLLRRSLDEPFSLYANIARTIETPEDRSWAAFEIDPRARFADGAPIEPEDVIWTLDTLRTTKARPYFRQFFREVAKAEKVGRHGLRFQFRDSSNRELALLVASSLPVLSRAWWSKHDFDRPLMTPPVGAGRYRLAEIVPGRTAVYERIKDHWAEDLPSQRGSWNFDTIRIDYVGNTQVAREAVKSGYFDYRNENQASAWASAYDIESVRAGHLVKRAVRHRRTAGMQAFILNARRWPFQHVALRRAVALAYDFEWANANLFHGQYKRSLSYFNNSELASRAPPEGEEKEILERLRGRVPESVFGAPYALPENDGSGHPRAALLEAARLLKDAGFALRDMRLVDGKSGRKVEFEILLAPAQSGFDRIVLPYVRNLRRLGIEARVRNIDTSQWINRVRKFDFDVVVGGWGSIDSPGNEQRAYWNSAGADVEGGVNYPGLKDKAVDELVELVIEARDRESLVARTRALDRVLLAHHLCVPQWYFDSDRLVFWDKFGIPPPTREGTSYSVWWVDAEKARRLKAATGNRVRSLA